MLLFYILGGLQYTLDPRSAMTSKTTAETVAKTQTSLLRLRQKPKQIRHRPLGKPTFSLTIASRTRYRMLQTAMDHSCRLCRDGKDQADGEVKTGGCCLLRPAQLADALSLSETQ